MVAPLKMLKWTVIIRIGACASLQVLVPKRAEFKGKMIKVDIYEAGKHFMKGQPVENSKPFTPSIAAPLQKGEVSGLTQVKTHTHNWKPHLLWYYLYFSPKRH